MMKPKGTTIALLVAYKCSRKYEEGGVAVGVALVVTVEVVSVEVAVVWEDYKLEPKSSNTRTVCNL